MAHILNRREEKRRMSTNRYKISLLVIILCTLLLPCCTTHTMQDTVDNYPPENTRIEYGIIYGRDNNTANIRLENGRKLPFLLRESFSVGDRVRVFYQGHKVIETELIER